jgi:hypothetical protein
MEKKRETPSAWFYSFFVSFKKPNKTSCAKGQEHTFEYEEPSTKQKRTMNFNDAHIESHL